MGPSINLPTPLTPCSFTHLSSELLVERVAPAEPGESRLTVLHYLIHLAPGLQLAVDPLADLLRSLQVESQVLH